MSTNGTALILDLDELFKPQATVTIDGKHYQFRHWDALSLREQSRGDELYARMHELLEFAKPKTKLATNKDIETTDEYHATVRELMRIVSSSDEASIQGAPFEKVNTAVLLYFGYRAAEQGRLLARIRETAITPIQTMETSSPASTTAGRKRTRRSG